MASTAKGALQAASRGMGRVRQPPRVRKMGSEAIRRRVIQAMAIDSSLSKATRGAGGNSSGDGVRIDPLANPATIAVLNSQKAKISQRKRRKVVRKAWMNGFMA